MNSRTFQQFKIPTIFNILGTLTNQKFKFFMFVTLIIGLRIEYGAFQNQYSKGDGPVEILLIVLIISLHRSNKIYPLTY